MEKAHQGDEDFLQAAVYRQQLACEGYNRAAGDCTSRTLRSAFLRILEEEHEIRADILQEFQLLADLQPELASQQQIDQLRRQYSARC